MVENDCVPAGKGELFDARAYVQEACSWVKNNPDSFRQLLRLCHRAVDEGNPSVQRGDIFNLARDAGLTISEAHKLKRDNNLWSPLTRYMVMLQPRLSKCLRFRASGADQIDLIAEWREIVNAGTFFFARNWREAKDLCESKDACVR